MDNLYLKEVNETDIDILKNYNGSCRIYNEEGWVSEEKFVSLIKEWKNDINDMSKLHVYPFWLMKDDEVVGVIIIKDNIDVDYMWKNFGGNISYVIAPGHRRKGYGKKSLNLALQKCKELGMDTILISCLYHNTASMKIIESNYGKLKDIKMDDTNTENNGKLTRRYLINIEESLRLYNEANSSAKAK